MRISTTKLLSIAAFVFAAYPTAISAAINGVPDNAAAFVAFCPTHAKACHEEIMDVSNMNGLRQMGMNMQPWQNAKSCMIGPAGHVSTVQERAEHDAAIFDWLTGHPEENAKDTSNAINDAITALWPC